MYFGNEDKNISLSLEQLIDGPDNELTIFIAKSKKNLPRSFLSLVKMNSCLIFYQMRLSLSLTIINYIKFILKTILCIKLAMKVIVHMTPMKFAWEEV